MVDTGAGGTAGAAAGTAAGTCGVSAPGAATSWLGPAAAAAGAPACTVTGCVTVAGAGAGSAGPVGSAVAVVPARPRTHAVPAAKPPASSPHRRAFSNI